MAKKFRERFKTAEDVFDEFTIRNLFNLSSKGFFDDNTLSPIAIGKEANVFSARKGSDRVIVKIYRLETADFKKMYDYIKIDPRYDNLKKNMRSIIFAWTQREYRNLMTARKALVRTPLPIAFMKNILILSFIGDESAALKIKDGIPRNPQEFLGKIVENMKRLYKGGLVHGDLSKFNILNYDESPVLIDFSQGAPLRSPHALDMLRRDIHNICEFFKKLGVNTEEDKLFAHITSSNRITKEK